MILRDRRHPLGQTDALTVAQHLAQRRHKFCPGREIQAAGWIDLPRRLECGKCVPRTGAEIQVNCGSEPLKT